MTNSIRSTLDVDFSRRRMLKGMLLAGGLLGVPGVLAACSSDSTSDSAPQSDLATKFGVEIPKATVNFGLAPFGDHVIYAVAMSNGWYDEVGIKIGPKNYSTIPYEQINALLINGDYDVTTQFAPNQLQSMVRAPQVKQFMFSDTYYGIFILASPDSGLKTVSELVEGGTSFDDAMRTVVAQLDGKRVAIDDTGSHRAFLDTVFELGNFDSDSIGELLTVDDSRMLILARGGKVDFCKPLGGAQTAELIRNGWYPIVGANDLVEGLPNGDPRGVSGLGHVGLSTTEEYYKNNLDTIHRLAGVTYRVVDAIKADIENETEVALKKIVPVLEAAAALKLSTEDLRIIYSTVDPMRTFEEQSEYWTEPDNPLYIDNVYGPQIEAAQEGGVLPADQDLSPRDVFWGGEVYEALLEYKAQYDELLPKASDLSGDAKGLADEAATQYTNRSYLDAARFLQAAVEA